MAVQLLEMPKRFVLAHVDGFCLADLLPLSRLSSVFMFLERSADAW